MRRGKIEPTLELHTIRGLPSNPAGEKTRAYSRLPKQINTIRCHFERSPKRLRLDEGALIMNIRETYRLNEAILSIHSDSENSVHRIPIMVPSGAIVTIMEGPLDGLRLVDVLWEKKTVTMSTVDLRKRAPLMLKR